MHMCTHIHPVIGLCLSADQIPGVGGRSLSNAGLQWVGQGILTECQSQDDMWRRLSELNEQED